MAKMQHTAVVYAAAMICAEQHVVKVVHHVHTAAHTHQHTHEHTSKIQSSRIHVLV
jgi:hypothetical protein